MTDQKGQSSPTSIVSPNIRVRHPEFFEIGEYSIVDDFCYFSAKVRVGKFSHIASGCCVAGGEKRRFSLGNYSSLSAGVKIWCTSDDYVRDLICIIPDPDLPIKANLITGDVIFENFTGVGANSVVMPRNHIPEGTVIGALSFVPAAFDFKPWSVYAGTPIRLIGPRDRQSVLTQVEKLEMFLSKSAVSKNA